MRGSKAKLIPRREQMLDREMRIYEILPHGQHVSTGARKAYKQNKRKIKEV